jgi:hypothetical protein
LSYIGKTVDARRPDMPDALLLTVDMSGFIMSSQSLDAHSQQPRHGGRGQVGLVGKSAANRLRYIVIVIAHAQTPHLCDLLLKLLLHPGVAVAQE